MNELLNLWSQVPAIVQNLVLGVLLILAALLVLRLVQALHERLKPDGVVLAVLQATLFTAIDEAYAKITAEIDNLTAPEADEKIRQIAGDLYEALPDLFIIEWKGRKVPVPVKAIVSKELFIDLCLAVYHEATALVEELQGKLREAYDKWKAVGGPLPEAGRSLTAWAIEVQGAS